MKTKSRILVVDDEVGIRRGCQRVLEPAGFAVVLAATLQEGLDQIQTQDLDLVLTDVMLPDGRGIDLLPPGHDKDPDLICVVITGYATIELAVEAMKLGAYDFIAKPFNSDLLLMTVQQGLEKRHLSLEAKRLQAIEEKAARLTEEKRDLEQRDRIKTEFMLTVGYELHNPATAVQNYLLELVKGYNLPDRPRQIVRQAIERNQDLLGQVDGLLSLAVTREALVMPQRQVFALADALDKLLPLLQAQADAKDIQLRVECRQRPLVCANPDQMGRVWLHLIANAIQYTPAGGEIAVSLDTADGQAVGMVTDTGIGITPEDQARVFD
ncbi:MAG: response regulator, partial [Chloroflexi bacterium]|nr:response regulator [Chloroflexota bacterium]